MSLRRTILPTAMCFLMGSSLSSAGAQEAEKAKVRRPGWSPTPPRSSRASTFWLGVHFEIEDGWHIYWRNPGGAGLATAIDFELPDGVVTGSLRWPLPIAFDPERRNPGFRLRGFGGARIRGHCPGRLRPIAAVPQIRAEVSWLACKSVCVRWFGRARRIVGKAFGGSRFSEPGSRTLPRPFAEGEGIPLFTLTTTGGLAGGTVTHWLRWRKTPRVSRVVPRPVPAPSSWITCGSRRAAGLPASMRRCGVGRAPKV